MEVFAFNHEELFFNQSGIFSEIISFLTLIIPAFTKNSIAFTNSVSEIASVAHHPAVFFTQSGMPSVLVFPSFDVETLIIPAFTKNSIAFTNSISEIASVAHHPAVFFTQSGVLSAFTLDIDPEKITINNNNNNFMTFSKYR